MKLGIGERMHIVWEVMVVSVFFSPCFGVENSSFCFQSIDCVSLNPSQNSGLISPSDYVRITSTAW